MPKIIPELRERIVEIAEDLYAKNSYTEIDMRKISQLCGIAVGTLYNYFPNKQALFVSIFEKSWDRQVQNIQKVINSNISTVNKLERVIGKLYRDLIKYKGIGEECFEREIFVRERDKMIMLKNVFNQLFKRINEMVTGLIQELSREQGVILADGDIKRLSCIMLYSLPGMAMHFPGQEKDNVNCILETIHSYIKEKAVCNIKSKHCSEDDVDEEQ